jgi:hypothetical protein
MSLLINQIEIHQIICPLHRFNHLFKSRGNVNTLQNKFNVWRPMWKNKQRTNLTQLYDQLTIYKQVLTNFVWMIEGAMTISLTSLIYQRLF